VGDSSTLCSGYPVFDLTSSENSFRFVTPAGNMLGWGLYSQGRWVIVGVDHPVRM
jgi:hypothetical protein